MVESQECNTRLGRECYDCHMATLADYVYRRDFAKRTPMLSGPMTVLVASHLGHQDGFSVAAPLLHALRIGGDLTPHISPMKEAKRQFKKAAQGGDWSRYMAKVDQILNKWGIYHFHLNGGAHLLFVHLCQLTATARVLELASHSAGFAIERRLVQVVVENWPDAGLVRIAGQGSSEMSEDDLLNARKQGVNMPVEVSGTFYLPADRALMSDGSGYELLNGPTPIFVVGERFGAKRPAGRVRHPQMYVAGVEPGDPRSPQMIAAAEMGRIAVRRRELLKPQRDAFVSACVQRALQSGRR